MAKLNEKNTVTEKVIHLMVTSLCNRDCAYCCNKQYDINDIPYVTHEELLNADTICITGGEPFSYSNPCEIAMYYRKHYPNIKNIYVYTNAAELAEYLIEEGKIYCINGVSVSIKNITDRKMFNLIIRNNYQIKALPSNLLYVFDNLYSESVEHFSVIKREWQCDFVPDPNSIFRKV